MQPTDPGLDERVCRKLGWEPLGWKFQSPDGSLGEATNSAASRDAYLALGWILVNTGWPPISTSWEWAGRALEEMQRLGFNGELHLSEWKGKRMYHCYFYGSDGRFDETGPLAIARAIDAALPEVKP